MRRGTGVGGGGMTASGEWAAGGTGLGSLGPDLAQQSLARSVEVFKCVNCAQPCDSGGGEWVHQP